MLIFSPGISNEYRLPPGTWAEAHETVRITKPLFRARFLKFIKLQGGQKDSSLLLLLDGHGSLMQSFRADRYCKKEIGVMLLCFPPHCTPTLQPVDVSFTKPFNLYYEKVRS